MYICCAVSDLRKYHWKLEWNYIHNIQRYELDHHLIILTSLTLSIPDNSSAVTIVASLSSVITSTILLCLCLISVILIVVRCRGMSRSVRDLECNQSRKSMKEETKSNTRNTYQEHSPTVSAGSVEIFNWQDVPSNISLPSLTDSMVYEAVYCNVFYRCPASWLRRSSLLLVRFELTEKKHSLYMSITYSDNEALKCETLGAVCQCNSSSHCTIWSLVQATAKMNNCGWPAMLSCDNNCAMRRVCTILKYHVCKA